MKLQDKLDAIREQASMTRELAEALRHTVADLVDSGTAARALGANDHMPEFALPNSAGRLIHSDVVLARGPLVLTFYSGMWCPFANAELEALEAVRSQVEVRGATMLALSQQTPSNNGQVERSHKLGFPILSDRNGDVADAFGLRCAIAADLLTAYRLIGLDLCAMNGESSGTLPMSSRYVVDSSGVIVYAEVNADYTRRPDPSEVLPTLNLLARSRGEGASAY